MSNQANTCPIWGPNAVARVQYDSRDDTISVDSLRADGYYKITMEAMSMMRSDGMDDSEKARLTTMLVDEREQGVQVPIVLAERVDEAKKADPLPVPKRAERLLRYLVKCSAGEIGSQIPVLDVRTPDYARALAWSESTGGDEIVFLSDYLSQKGWVEILEYTDGIERITVTVDGYARIDSLKTSSVDSAQAFVAMWFDDEMNDAYEKGIKPAIEQSGYTPMRIDRKPDANKIDDDIIAEIRRSRFLIADMTHRKDDGVRGSIADMTHGKDNGARGSVYFEAGFAMGLGIPVIYTCRSDLMDEVHFDTRQYAYIVWEKGEETELQGRLLQRILARIGEGPNKA